MTPFTPELAALLKRIYTGVNSSYFDEQNNYCHRIPATFSAAERQLLADAGLEPNTFIQFGHDDAVRALRRLAAKVKLRRAADAFVAAMTSADLSWFSILPATALGLAMPQHQLQPFSETQASLCSLCFHRPGTVDRTMSAYFRHLEGGGWGAENVVKGVLALDAVADDSLHWPQPTPRDIWVLYRILELLRQLPEDARYSKARTALKDAKLLSHNSAARCETVLEALAFIGVLQTPDHPGMFTAFTPASERDRRPTTRTEVPGPLAWWCAADGINSALVAHLFGHLICPATEPPAARPEKKRRAQVSSPRPKALPGPAAAGDVYAIRYREDVWGAAYCHEVQDLAADMTYGRIEYLDILSPTPTTVDQVQGLSFRDRLEGERWQAWFSHLDKATGVKRIARGVPAPAHHLPLPAKLPRGNAKELRHLAGWHFDF